MNLISHKLSLFILYIHRKTTWRSGVQPSLLRFLRLKQNTDSLPQVLAADPLGRAEFPVHMGHSGFGGVAGVLSSNGLSMCDFDGFSLKLHRTQHNLCCDNCHSHVARALNNMRYGNSDDWNMVKLAISMCLHSRFVRSVLLMMFISNFVIVLHAWIIISRSLSAFVKTWLPFCILLMFIFGVSLATNSQHLGS